MSEDDAKSPKDQNRAEAVCRQYRDWLIPGSLFVGVAASVILFAMSLNMTLLTLVAAGLGLGSVLAFLLALFWAMTRLESVEVFGWKAEEHGPMFILPCLGILFLLGSLTALAFWKSTLLGGCFIGLATFAVFVLVRLLRAEARIGR